ncbi:hypothetical protein [Oceanibium sediminis]|uniref:hypothetical protein n=1 Tax=Oceanibium sediminis TaxID=2026339 RepID=UPI00130023C5|nr:hypothetical protein [Oceanibium sediminis]
MAESQAEGLTLNLPEVANLEAACALVSRMAEADHAAPLTLDASAVGTISAPYVLSLVSVINARAEHAPKIVVSQPTAPFLDAFSDLGLFSDLMKMEFAT